MIDTVTATLSGTVEKIIKPSVHGEPEKSTNRSRGNGSPVYGNPYREHANRQGGREGAIEAECQGPGVFLLQETLPRSFEAQFRSLELENPLELSLLGR